MKWAGVALVILIAVAVVAYKMTFPSYSYRYRLQLTLEMEGKAYTGSSVIEVNWGCGLKIADSGCAASLGGQATLIDLGARGIVVAALRSGENIIPVPDGAVDAVGLCGRAFGNQGTYAELPALHKLTGRRDLSPSNFPRLIWFSNAVDPKIAIKITPQDVARILDPTARFTEAFVEITKDPIVVNIADKLPWFSALQRMQKSGQGPLSKTGQFQLVHNMFVGERS